jgi:hypothetical protein
MKRPLPKLIWIAFLVTPWAIAQVATQVGSVVKGFTLPQHNEAGELEARISGDEATTVSPNRTIIKSLKLELFEGGKSVTTILSPKCDFWYLQGRLNTREGVIIDRKEMEITAKTMEWEFKEKRGTLQKEVRVVIRDLDLGTTLVAPVKETKKATEPPKVEEP